MTNHILTEPSIQATDTEPSTEQVTTIHVISKTHLDIGFTDFARNVVTQYYERFIPQALATAEALRIQGGTERLIWTTGSWLNIPLTLATQLLLIPFIDFSTVSGVLTFNLLAALPSVLLNLALSYRGFHEPLPIA